MMMINECWQRSSKAWNLSEFLKSRSMLLGERLRHSGLLTNQDHSRSEESTSLNRCHSKRQDMASFTDRKGNQWRVDLDAPTISEIRDEHGVNLVGFESDPLGPLRNDPMKLVTVIAAICREQIAEKSLSPIEFARLLPSPPDPMLDAVRDAVVGFFPSGQASHRLEVLAKFEQMATKTNELAAVKMQQVMDDPEVMKTLDDKANRVIKQAIQKMAQSVGT